MEKNKRRASRAAQKGWRFNFLDVVIILLIVAVVGSSVALLIPRVTEWLGNDGDITVVYTVVFTEIDEELAMVAEIVDGQTVKDRETGRVLGTVIGDALVDDCYEFVVRPGTEQDDLPMLESGLYEGKKTLTVTLTASATYSEGRGYEINGRRIACNTELEMIFPSFTGHGVCTVVSETDGDNY